MKISNRFMTGLISKGLKWVVKKKLGCKADVRLNEVRATYSKGVHRLHLDIDADVTQEELEKLLSNFGIS